MRPISGGNDGCPDLQRLPINKGFDPYGLIILEKDLIDIAIINLTIAALAGVIEQECLDIAMGQIEQMRMRCLHLAQIDLQQFAQNRMMSTISMSTRGLL